MSVEEQLTEIFREQARAAPDPSSLLPGAVRRVRTRRRRITVGAVAVVAVLALGGTSLILGRTTVAPLADDLGTVPVGKAGAALPVGDAMMDCVYEYSPTVVAEKLDFAFDGTVVSVGDPVSQRPGDPEPWDYVGVTFRVNEWFKGGSAPTFTVDLMAPGSRSTEDAAGLGYRPGTRLLVSGMARWGGGDPLRYPVAWMGCGGFSRYYGDRVADSWRTAMG